MIKLGGLVELKALNEEEVFTATNKETGNVSVFKSKASRDAAVKGGSHEMRKDDKEDGVEKPELKKDTPKVNIFDKPSSDKQEPKSEPSQPKRQGNSEVNKKTTELAKEMGLTPQNFQSKKEYQDTMVGAAVSALTDANFHSEARELVAKVLGRPELAQKPDYPSLKDPEFDQKMAKIKDFYSAGDKYTKPSDEAQEFGEKVAQEAGWSGDDALDGIAHELRQNGFGKLADTIQSVIKENKSTRLKDLS